MEMHHRAAGAGTDCYPGAGIRPPSIPAVDYSHEPTTLVVFELAEAEGGTVLTRGRNRAWTTFRWRAVRTRFA